MTMVRKRSGKSWLYSAAIEWNNSLRPAMRLTPKVNCDRFAILTESGKRAADSDSARRDGQVSCRPQRVRRPLPVHSGMCKQCAVDAAHVHRRTAGA